MPVWRGSKPTRKDLRVGRPERERAIAALGEHFVAERLTIQEYEQRCTGAANARFQSELAAQLHDLPAAGPEGTEPSTRECAAAHAHPAPRSAFAFTMGVCLVAGALALLMKMWVLAALAVVATVTLARWRR